KTPHPGRRAGGGPPPRPLRREEVASARLQNLFLSLGLVEEGQVLALLADRAPGTEVVLTGRDAPPALVEQSDYCTEMCCRKHPFERGVPARKGIEF
ncbi:cob(I)yrinic acid a,c-diamide adenosyltransferase, partial [Bittarella massiliensis (ex Durand et al. 2017)]